MNVTPGTVLKQSDCEPDRLYILLKGKVAVYTPKHNSAKEKILLNEYFPGQSFCDPMLNETASAATLVTVTGKRPAKLFYLTKTSYF